jgi:hypothetical protein
MRKDTKQTEQMAKVARHRVRLPGFLIEHGIGLGDLIKKTTYALGIKPCVGCERRAQALNRWVRFTR